MAYIRGKEICFSARIGGGSDKFNSLVDGSITEITDKDLEGISTLKSYVFSDCKNLTRATIPNSITKLPSSVFSGCTSLTSIYLPEGLTVIGTAAFSGCTSLESIVIPSTVTSIESNVFFIMYGKLTTITVLATTPPSLSNTMGWGGTIYIPKGTLSAYQGATNWSALNLVELES